jgi:hypothetical protein
MVAQILKTARKQTWQSECVACVASDGAIAGGATARVERGIPVVSSIEYIGQFNPIG